MLVTTANEIAGHRVVRHIGVVRGVVVRSRSVFGNIGGALQSLFGGNITIYTHLAEQTRQQSFDLLIQHAQDQGANAIVGMRYDATEIMAGITEVLAYGTALVIERAR